MTFVTGQFQLDRRFAIAPAALWHILIDPKERETWGAPSEDMILVMDKSDTREDGHEIHRCGPKDDPEFTVDTRWYRLDAPQAACFTETLTFGGERAMTSLVTYKLAPDGSGTDLTVHVALTSFMGDEVLGEVEGGWTGALERLQARLATA